MFAKFSLNLACIVAALQVFNLILIKKKNNENERKIISV
jgi:hypothetical protein